MQVSAQDLTVCLPPPRGRDKAHRDTVAPSYPVIALLLCLLLVPMQATSAGSPKGQRSALTSVSAVQDLEAPADPDDPRGGGGFDAEGYFQNIVIAKVSTCTAGVLKEFAAWSKTESLTITKTTQSPTSVLAFVNLPSPGGVLELDYRFHPDTKRSRATLFFFSADGSKHEPVALEALLKKYSVATLQDSIRTAIACP